MADYTFKYQDGSTGSSPYRRDASGQIILNSAGGIADEGTYVNTPGGAAAMAGAGMGVGVGSTAPATPNYGGGGSFGGGAAYGGGAAAGGVNPYTQQQATSIRDMVNQNLSTNIMPGIAASAVGNGSYGGSRQGVAQGVAAGQASTGLANSLAQLYSGNYQFDTTAGQNQQSINNNFLLGAGGLANQATANQNNYTLGQGQLGNQATTANQNFYTAQRGQDLQQYQIGSGLYGAGVNGNVALGSGMYGTGQAAYSAPNTALQQYGSTISPYTGLGQSTTQNTSGSVAAGALGGAIGANTLANMWGGTTSNTSTSEPYPGYNASIGLK